MLFEWSRLWRKKGKLHWSKVSLVQDNQLCKLLRFGKGIGQSAVFQSLRTCCRHKGFDCTLVTPSSMLKIRENKKEFKEMIPSPALTASFIQVILPRKT